MSVGGAQGIVLDCSIAVGWLVADEASAQGDAVLETVRTSNGHVPSLFWFEIANVMTSAVRRKRLTLSDVRPRLDLLAALPLLTDADSTARATRDTVMIATTYGLTAYDAAYLELALRLGVPLATFDRDMTEAARALGVATAF